MRTKALILSLLIASPAWADDEQRRRHELAEIQDRQERILQAAEDSMEEQRRQTAAVEALRREVSITEDQRRFDAQLEESQQQHRDFLKGLANQPRWRAIKGATAKDSEACGCPKGSLGVMCFDGRVWCDDGRASDCRCILD